MRRELVAVALQEGKSSSACRLGEGVPGIDWRRLAAPGVLVAASPRATNSRPVLGVPHATRLQDEGTWKAGGRSRSFRPSSAKGSRRLSQAPPPRRRAMWED